MIESLIHEGKQFRRVAGRIERHQNQEGRGTYWQTVHPGPLYRTLERKFDDNKVGDDEFPPLKSISISGT